ncbi:MAG: DUF2796 domain-containing protein [Hyphomicrobiaceae bacterium]|nr:DUF2796 domain-containing protein [Hyphomicrobiaceae bacterium]
MLTLSVAAAQAQGRHEHGPHVHGHGTLNIAIEGSKVSMSLEVPGADIVGFEHKPKTDKQKAALVAAKAALAAPLSLFVPPAEAGCKLVASEVKFEVEGGDGHASFHATYALSCGSVDKLSTLEFAYFGKFAKANEVEVQLIAPKGVSKYEVTRKARLIRLKGIN